MRPPRPARAHAEARSSPPGASGQRSTISAASPGRSPAAPMRIGASAWAESGAIVSRGAGPRGTGAHDAIRSIAARTAAPLRASAALRESIPFGMGAKIHLSRARADTRGARRRDAARRTPLSRRGGAQ